jgi:hypothetical protein
MAEKIEELKKQLAEAQAKAEKFERLHADGVIERELREAAQDAGAFNADQVITLLKGKSRLVDAGGKQVVRVVAVGDDGQETHHSTAQAIWHMKQNKDNDNFFRDTLPTKPTLAPPPQIDSNTDLRELLKNMPMEQYMKLRAERPEILGLKPLPNSGR